MYLMSNSNKAKVKGGNDNLYNSYKCNNLVGKLVQFGW